MSFIRSNEYSNLTYCLQLWLWYIQTSSVVQLDERFESHKNKTSVDDFENCFKWNFTEGEVVRLQNQSKV